MSILEVINSRKSVFGLRIKAKKPKAFFQKAKKAVYVYGNASGNASDKAYASINLILVRQTVCPEKETETEKEKEKEKKRKTNRKIDRQIKPTCSRSISQSVCRSISLVFYIRKEKHSPLFKESV
ncbi:MAG: hypothetical protein K6F91_08755 [Ruminococcus sp.]|nr:hypothetical protein [Ruminococcus sp.]